MLYAPQNTSKTLTIQRPFNSSNCLKKRGCLDDLFYQMKEKTNPSPLKKAFSFKKNKNHPSSQKKTSSPIEHSNFLSNRRLSFVTINEQLCHALSRSIYFCSETIVPLGSSQNLDQVTEL